MDAGIQPTHLDSHHHVHLWPGLTEIACQLAGEFGIPAVRAINPQSLGLMKGNVTWERYILRTSWRRALMFPQAKPSTVVGMEAMPGTLGGMDGYLGKLGSGVHELFCHPGTAGDEDLVLISSLTEKRAVELETLCSDWFREVLKDNNIELTSYRILGEERV